MRERERVCVDSQTPHDVEPPGEDEGMLYMRGLMSRWLRRSHAGTWWSLQLGCVHLPHCAHPLALSSVDPTEQQGSLLSSSHLDMSSQSGVPAVLACPSPWSLVDEAQRYSPQLGASPASLGLFFCWCAAPIRTWRSRSCMRHAIPRSSASCLYETGRVWSSHSALLPTEVRPKRRRRVVTIGRRVWWRNGWGNLG